MTDLYSFIRSLLEWPFSELFFFDESLWNQYKFIILRFSRAISRKILIITIITNEATNELAIYAKLCWNITIFYLQELPFLLQVQGKLRDPKKPQPH